MNRSAEASRSSDQGGTATKPERFTAVPVRISDILACSFVRQEGWKLNYLLAPSGRRITRLNLIAVLVSKVEERTLVLDDGSGVITARLLEAAPACYAPGDVLLLIARPGEVDGTKYVLPEIVKKLDNAGWLRVRKLEMERPGQLVDGGLEPAEEAILPAETPAPLSVGSADAAAKSNAEHLCAIIRELDTGGGADVSLVEGRAAAENIDNAETVIQNLLEQGEIFMPRPGLVKTLE